MCEQVKSLDINARKVVYQEKAPADIMEEVVDILIGFLEASPTETKTKME